MRKIKQNTNQKAEHEIAQKSKQKAKMSRVIISVAMVLLITLNVISCSKTKQTDGGAESTASSDVGNPEGVPSDASDASTKGPTLETDDTSSQGTPPSNTSTGATEPPESPPETPRADLVPYDGIVEHLFFHEVIAYPQLAFDGDSGQQGYDEYMVTVGEYVKMLESIYSKGYILVNMNDVWSEHTTDSGARRMKKNTLMIPEGKKPLILSFDDISFYEYMSKDGFMEKLIIGPDGEIWDSGFDPSGNPVVTQEMTVVTVLDKFVKEHPDFSLDGVKGCIALTGYEGILGYRTQFDSKNDTPEARINRTQEIARVRPVIQKLKDTGWYFATHSYGHINLNKASLNGVKTDADRWLNEVGSLIGETTLFIYPFGSRLDGGDVNKTGPSFQYYVELGFRVFASVGIESYSKIKSDINAVICDRMHADGGTLRRERTRYMKFYDAIEVFDPMRPSVYGNKW